MHSKISLTVFRYARYKYWIMRLYECWLDVTRILVQPGLWKSRNELHVWNGCMYAHHTIYWTYKTYCSVLSKSGLEKAEKGERDARCLNPFILRTISLFLTCAKTAARHFQPTLYLGPSITSVNPGKVAYKIVGQFDGVKYMDVFGKEKTRRQFIQSEMKIADRVSQL